MNNNVFRKKSLEKISSPEQIDDYMKVTGPSIWILLCSIILLLVALFVWGITGRIEDNVVKDGKPQTEEIAPIELLTEK